VDNLDQQMTCVRVASNIEKSWVLIAAVAITFALTLPETLRAQSIPVDAVSVDATTTVVLRTATPSSDIPAPYRGSGLTSNTITALGTSVTLPIPFPFDNATMMPVADIRPGMKGYGLTVFSGLEPEKFEAEVIGVRHRMLAGTDIILCRLKSPHLVDLGVVAGMSGSPVFMDGKLIGAVAYGFMDVDDPLAGVTPIGEMLRVYNSTPEQPSAGPDETGAASNGMDVFENYMALRANPTIENLRRVAMPASPLHSLTVNATDFGAGIMDKYNLPDSFTLEPLSAPVFLGAQSAVTRSLAQTVFPGLDIELTSQPATPAATGPAGQTLIPDASTTGIPSTDSINSPGGPIASLQAFADKLSGGYAMAIPFVEGDLNMAGVGTITWRHGNRLVAFGHPMMQRGTVYFPMAAARINAIIRSRTRPFKLGEPVGHIGMVRQDRVPAVGGLFGQTAKMFSLKTVINDPNYIGAKEHNFRIFNDRGMSPGLVMAALGESIGSAARTDGDSAALFGYSIHLDDGTSISAENYNSDSNGTIQAIIGAMADIGALMNNPFKPVGVNDVEFHMQVTDRLRQAKLEAATMDKAIYQPGETAAIEWVLRPFRQEPVRLNYSFTVPDYLPDGDYTIVVMDANSRNDLETKRNPGGRNLNDYEDLVHIIQRNFPQNRVYIALVDQDTGVSVNGKEMPRLPGSIINAIQETVDSEYFEPVRGNFVIDADLATSYEISGQVKAKLTIKRK
jgi:hypothetical protein